ncbi:MAG: ribosomal protein S18-alanine N-acetyltransferase [Saccharofermentans sp.]|nr:ribosomal protein S18-alanine N-acetyltransferase [Saccharofermentans sp.]
MIVREARQEEVHIIMEIESSGIRHPWTYDLIESLITSDKKVALVAADEDDIPLGYVGASFLFEEAEIGNICVLPEARGKGIGQLLMIAMDDFMRAHGVEKIFLEVESDNIPAISLYEKSNYSKYNARSNYYGQGLDALLYVKNLNG